MACWRRELGPEQFDLSVVFLHTRAPIAEGIIVDLPWLIFRQFRLRPELEQGLCFELANYVGDVLGSRDGLLLRLRDLQQILKTE